MENGTRMAQCAPADAHSYLQFRDIKQLMCMYIYIYIVYYCIIYIMLNIISYITFFYVYYIFIQSHLKSVYVLICHFNIQFGPSHDFAKAQIQAKVVLHGAPMLP